VRVCPEESEIGTTILAVYENGLLRPVKPLPLPEGETVEITLARIKDGPSAQKEEQAVERIRAARTLEDWIAAANATPVEEDGYDLLRALQENRQSSGDQRPLFPSEREGSSR